MAKDLSEMSLEELRSHAKDVAKAIARKEAERLAHARQALQKKAQEFGTSIEELFGKKASSQSKSAKSGPMKVLYIDDDGKEWGRAKSGWTDAQKKKFKANRDKVAKSGS